MGYVGLLSDKAVLRQGSGSAGLKASQPKIAEGSTLSSYVMFLCFLLCLQCISAYLNYTVFVCGEEGVLPSFHESIFINS